MINSQAWLERVLGLDRLPLGVLPHTYIYIYRHTHIYTHIHIHILYILNLINLQSRLEGVLGLDRLPLGVLPRLEQRGAGRRQRLAREDGGDVSLHHLQNEEYIAYYIFTCIYICKPERKV